jgi:hypothetical protein
VWLPGARDGIAIVAQRGVDALLAGRNLTA